MKVDTPDKLKFKRTVRDLRPLLNCPVIDVKTLLVGLLELLWRLTARNAPRGNIGKFSNEEIAEEVGWLGDADKLIEILVGNGWIEHHSIERLIVHNWAIHCPNFVKGNADKNGGFVVSEVNKPSTPKAAPKDSPKADPKAPPNELPNVAPEASPNDGPKGGPTYSSPVNSIQTSSCKVVEEEGILDLFKARGIAKAKAALQAAYDQGLTDTDIRNIVAEFDLRPAGCWKNPPGVLFARLTGELSSWPPYSESFVRQQQREAEQQRAAEASEENQRKREETERLHGEHAELELLHGSDVDALTREEQEALLLERYPTPESRAFLRPKQRRLELLELVSKRELNGTV